MKRWSRWSQKVGISGVVALTTLLASVTQALALTNEQVADRLRSVPVFAITTPDGVPLVNQVENEAGETVAITDLYINSQDAEAFLQELQSNNPELAAQVEVRPLSLADVFTAIIGGNEEGNVPRFSLIPSEEEVVSAVTLMQEQGEEVQEFEGVPLYYAEASGSDGGYLTITEGEQRVIPLYFEQDGLENLLSVVSESNPGLANSMEIQVTTLESLIGILLSEDSDPELNNIFLVPMVDSLEYIESQGDGAPATPAPAAE